MNLFSGTWFSSSNFSSWKLNTTMDYVYFILIIVIGVLIFKGVIALINRNRTPERAARRVEKRLLKLGGKGARVYRDFSFTPERGTPCPCEMLWLAQDQAYLVKVFWRGTQVSGKEEDESWRLGYNNGEEWVPNPLPILQKQRESFVRILTEHKITDVKIDPLVVCADNYETPRIFMKDVPGVVTLQQLPQWRKKHPISERRSLDIPAIEQALAVSLAHSSKSGAASV